MGATMTDTMAAGRDQGARETGLSADDHRWRSLFSPKGVNKQQVSRVSRNFRSPVN